MAADITTDVITAGKTFATLFFRCGKRLTDNASKVYGSGPDTERLALYITPLVSRVRAAAHTGDQPAI
ncbi:hypothetical protein [Streptomyces sp. NPDC056549]|uniref:hypothetical protein n=1 Tax=Streptomyces sp. NPDC056549 TaxID=3345864 RepID=UPI0036AE1A64